MLLTRKLKPVITKAIRNASLLSLLGTMGSPALAAANTLTFSGDCSLSINNQHFVPIETFDLAANENDCPGKSIKFSVPGKEGAIEYSVYVEFQRTEFAPGRRDKPTFVLHERNGGVANYTRSFNVQPGAVLDFAQGLKNGARVYCSGKIL